MSKIDSGYEGTNIPEDEYSIPPCGIEDVDKAVFDLFDKNLNLEVEVNQQTTRVPVVFAAGERFALTRRRQPIRDRNGALILPVIAIARKSIDISPDQGGYGTAISSREQTTYVIKRRLSSKDRNYQKVINKLRLKNQDNVATRGNFARNNVFPGNEALPGKIASRRNRENLSFLSDPHGYLLDGEISDNIFEIITAPYPDFFTAKYEVTFWTQYTVHMNQLLEVMMASFTGQGHEFQIESASGYQFVAHVNQSLTSGDNFENYSSDERLIRYTFNIDVPGYLLAPTQPGLPSPLRSFLSAPHIEFKAIQTRSELASPSQESDTSGDINRFILSDVEILDSNGRDPLTRGENFIEAAEIIEDPFTGKTEKKYLRVLTKDQRLGETTLSARSLVDLETLT